jgi:hypothetical protein
MMAVNPGDARATGLSFLWSYPNEGKTKQSFAQRSVPNRREGTIHLHRYGSLASVVRLMPSRQIELGAHHSHERGMQRPLDGRKRNSAPHSRLACMKLFETIEHR